VDSLAVKGSLCKNRETDWRLYRRNLSKKELRTGEVLKVDTGCIVGFTKDVDYDIEFGGIKNSIFGGEGLFYATFAALELFTYNLYLSADSLTELLLQHLKQDSRGEGSVLGGLGNLLDGDNRY
jgi:hypothetical protein